MRGGARAASESLSEVEPLNPLEFADEALEEVRLMRPTTPLEPAAVGASPETEAGASPAGRSCCAPRKPLVLASSPEASRPAPAAS